MLSSSLIQHLVQSANQLTKKLDSALSVHGINYKEYLILHTLYESPKQSLRRIDLAEKVTLTASGITRALQPLEKIGLTTKVANTRDARVSLVVLTHTGKTIVEDSKTTVEHSCTKLLEEVAPEMLQMLQSYLQ